MAWPSCSRHRSRRSAKPQPFAAKPAASENAKTWTPPRTPDGQPDLQGIWTDATNKPFERPKELGAKEFYTEAEAAALARKGYLGERSGPPEAHYDFSQYGMDAMQAKFAPDLRTSAGCGAGRTNSSHASRGRETQCRPGGEAQRA